MMEVPDMTGEGTKGVSVSGCGQREVTWMRDREK